LKIAIIIPARFKSSRFPGKPLAKILGVELIIRVLKICSKALNKKNIFVATDNYKIKKIVERNNFKSIMTSKVCKTGTDRVAEASKKIKAKIYINVQGDEPLINYKDILKIIKYKKKFPNHVICGYTKILKNENPKNLNIPKVAINKNEELVYMSRSVIPGSKENEKKLKIKYLKQVCIYAFNSEELKIYGYNKKKSNLEKLEDIEILRFFEINKKIKMVKTSSGSLAVDQKKDIKKIEKLLKSYRK